MEIAVIAQYKSWGWATSLVESGGEALGSPCWESGASSLTLKACGLFSNKRRAKR